MYRLALTLSFLPFALGGAGSVSAQGTTDYLNFESPQVKPLAIASVGGAEFLLACNTPDNSVEIIDITEDLTSATRAYQFIRRIPTGLEPVSVIWSPSQAAFYVCNMVGDSVTKVSLSLTAGLPATSLVSTLEATVQVGNEPMDLVEVDGSLLVTLNDRNSVQVLDLGDLSTIATVPIRRADSTNLQTLKEARRIITPPDIPLDVDLTFILDFQGEKPLPEQNGSTTSPRPEHGDGFDEPDFFFNLACYQGDMASPVGLSLGLETLGTTNLNMAAGTSSDDDNVIYLVGQEAQFELLGEEAVKNASSGFVQSMLYKITVNYPASGVLADLGTDPLTTTVLKRNLNLESTPPHDPVVTSSAISLPTDVVPYYDANGDVTLFIPSFGTDKIAIVEGTDGTSPEDWTVTTIDVPTASGNPMAGPRALAIATGISVDQVYVMNRLDNSIARFDPTDPTAASAVTVQALEHDPTPEYIRHGREFLYSAKLSGNHFVSCASCHVDGRLDGLRWHLGDPTATGATILVPEEFLETQPTAAGLNMNDPAAGEESVPAFRDDKGIMVTQSLQGLVNFEAELDRPAGNESQLILTNAPYHWRGDRDDFRDFNGAFVSLLGRSSELTESQMESFEKFINSIAYPPNPDQQKDRRYSGDIGEDANVAYWVGPPEDGVAASLATQIQLTPWGGPAYTAEGSGALLGLKLFHTRINVNFAGFPCVSCHALPEGSSNLIIQLSPDNFDSNRKTNGNGPFWLEGDPAVNLEVAALKSLRPKLYQLPAIEGSLITGGIGLQRSGNDHTLTDFADFAFQDATPSVVDFLMEFDTGVAPMIGVVHTQVFDPLYDVPAEVDAMIAQAEEGDVGLAAHVWSGGVLSGYWYKMSSSGTSEFYCDATDESKPYGGATGLMGSLSAVDPSDKIVLHATPVGSARRVASPTGVASSIIGPVPSIQSWLELRPLELLKYVPHFRDGWEKPGLFGNSTATERPFKNNDVVIALQAQLGIPLRHEPPRRLLVSGQNIRHGATLEIGLANNDPSVDCNSDYDLKFPLYATGELRNGERVWTTSVQVEAHIYYHWLAPDGASNSHALRVVNTDGTSACVAGVEMNLSTYKVFRRGDHNDDGVVTSADTQALLDYIYTGGAYACLDASDVDDNGVVNVLDALFLIDYLFNGGMEPPAPGPNACGLDPTSDGLGCESIDPRGCLGG